MKVELEQALFDKYNDLFKNRGKAANESLMCFGCECGDGWHGILDNLFGYIDHVLKNRSVDLKVKKERVTDENGGYIELPCPPVILDQVKEKYGTLRVYWHFDSVGLEKVRDLVEDEAQISQSLERYADMIEDAVDFSEYLSSQTCEVTGKAGKLYTDGWCVTLCEEEAIKRFGG